MCRKGQVTVGCKAGVIEKRVSSDRDNLFGEHAQLSKGSW